MHAEAFPRPALPRDDGLGRAVAWAVGLHVLLALVLLLSPLLSVPCSARASHMALAARSGMVSPSAMMMASAPVACGCCCLIHFCFAFASAASTSWRTSGWPSSCVATM